MDGAEDVDELLQDVEEPLNLRLVVILIVAAASAWWLFSSRSAGAPAARSSATGLSPDELRRRRLESLEKARPPTPVAVAASPTSAEQRSTSPGSTERSKSVEPTSGSAAQDAAKAAGRAAEECSPSSTSAPKEAKQEQKSQEMKVLLTDGEGGGKTAKPKIEVKPGAEENASSFGVKVRITTAGSPDHTLVEVSDCLCSTTCAEVSDRALSGSEAHSQARLFYKGKEIKDHSVTLQQLQIGAGATLQVTTARASSGGTPTGTSCAPVPRSDSCSTASTNASAPARLEPFSLRAQGTWQGAAVAHVLDNLLPTMTVIDLEDKLALTFGSGDARLRLFYMGRELKDGDRTLAAAGFKAGATVQVMFVSGQPRRRADNGTLPEATDEVPTATFAAPSAAVQGADVPAVTDSAPATPEEAWSAMFQLEAQLSRADNSDEEPMVRQSAQMLRGLLSALVREDSPALLQAAQALVPDLQKIWSYEPARERLVHLLRESEAGAPGQ